MNKRNLLMTLILMSASDLIVKTTAQCPKITHMNFNSSAYRQGLVFTELRVNSTLSCCKECLKRSLCHSFNYNRIEKICELNIAPTEDEMSQALSTDTNYVYGEASAIYKGLDRNCMNHTCPDWSVCVSNGTTTSCDTSIDVPKECSGMPWSRLYSTYASNGTSYLSITDYTCNPSSEYISGTTQAACRANGKWENPTIVCAVPPDCGPPPSRIGTSRVYNSTFVGDVVTYSCEDPWTYSSGFYTSTCEVNELWTPTPNLVCNPPPDCGPPPSIIGTTSVYNSTLVSDVVTYTCKDTWLYFSGSYSFTCGTNGEWTPTPNLFCIPTQCAAPTTSGRYIYVGSVNVTETGLPCLRFDHQKSAYDSINHFPYDTSMDQIGNHCRPTSNPNYRPWCYYEFILIVRKWEYCDIPVCTL